MCLTFKAVTRTRQAVSWRLVHRFVCGLCIDCFIILSFSWLETGRIYDVHSGSWTRPTMASWLSQSSGQFLNSPMLYWMKTKFITCLTNLTIIWRAKSSMKSLLKRHLNLNHDIVYDLREACRDITWIDCVIIDSIIIINYTCTSI